MSNLHTEKLVNFIQTSLLKDKGVQITPDTLLFKDRLLDSMNILDLIGFLEKELGRKLKDQEVVMSNFQSVSAMIKTFYNE